MTAEQEHRATVEFPSEREIVVTRAFDAPIDLLFDVMTKPEHLRHTVAPFEEEVTLCSVDLRVGGDYHYVFVPPGGAECSFRGTYLEVDAPTRTVETWRFDGWPDVEAVETMELSATDGSADTTTLVWTLTFRTAADRARMPSTDGIEGNFDQIAQYLATL